MLLQLLLIHLTLNGIIMLLNLMEKGIIQPDKAHCLLIKSGNYMLHQSKDLSFHPKILSLMDKSLITYTCNRKMENLVHLA